MISCYNALIVNSWPRKQEQGKLGSRIHDQGHAIRTSLWRYFCLFHWLLLLLNSKYHHYEWVLNQYFSNFNVSVRHLGILLKCRWSRSERGLRFCISNKLWGDAAGFQNMLCVAKFWTFPAFPLRVKVKDGRMCESRSHVHTLAARWQGEGWLSAVGEEEMYCHWCLREKRMQWFSTITVHLHYLGVVWH